jgi:hypothetical protein
MKFAAFISIIISVAVMFAACEGAVGPKGDKGDPGADGAPGAPGTSGNDGLPGTAALQARSNVDPTLLNDDELVDDEGRTVDSAETTPADAETKTLTVDLSTYFIGGTPGFTYEFVDMNGDTDGLGNDLEADASNVIDGEINNETGMLEYTLTIPSAGWDSELYTTGFEGDVKAIDDDGVAATATVTIMLNRKPTFTDTDGDGIVNDDAALVLGTMDGKRKDQDGDDTPSGAVANVNMACAEINECVLDLVFMDDGDITVTVTGMTRDDKDDSGKVGWETTDDGKVKLIGLASTWDADADVPADSPVTVKLKAVDERGLDAEVSVLVSVNAAPTVSDKGKLFAGTSRDVDESLTLTSAVSGWFENDEGTDTVTYTGESADTDTATITTEANDVLTGVDITAVTLGGTTTITVTATESNGLRQSASVEFTVTVTGVASGNG